MSTRIQFERRFEWQGSSGDPHDEQFGDVIEPATLETASEYDVVLVGEPYDGAVIGRPGAREGPQAIREALAGMKTHHFHRGAVNSIGDLGSLAIPAGEDVSTVQEHVQAVTRELHRRETLPVFLGGDNSLTYPNVAPLLDAQTQLGGDGSVTPETVGVINVDAHLDCRAVDGQPTSGSPYRQLLDAGLDSLAVVGARHFETSTAYVEFLREAGGEILTAETVGEGPKEAADRALSALDDIERVYVSVDVDVLDVTAGPGVSAPTPGGLTSRELFELVRGLASTTRLTGFEVVETAPPLCPDGRTAATAARVVAHALAGAIGGDGGRQLTLADGGQGGEDDD